MSRRVRKRFGWNASRASVKKDFNIGQKAGGGFGSSIEEVIHEFVMVSNDCTESYLISAVDYSDRDE